MYISPIAYIIEEVQRQGHDVNMLDGIERVGWMTNAWSYALDRTLSCDPDDFLITVPDILAIGMLVERVKNKDGFRKSHVRVGESAVKVHPDDLNILVSEFCIRLRDDHEWRTRPLDIYRAYEEIHPFVDGNGRSGKIILNWVNNTLLHPVFPPNDFWGRTILNP